MGSGLPQFGFPRRFAIDLVSLIGLFALTSPATGLGGSCHTRGHYSFLFYGFFLQKSIKK
jgi:hypothetical protein